MFALKVTLLSLAASVTMNVNAKPQLPPGPIGPQLPPAPIAPISPAFVPIEAQHFDLNPDQSYTFGYRSADGSTREEVGVPRVPGPEGPAVAVQGSFSYQTPEGRFEQSYIADENGFQPTGNAVHPAIVKAVAAQVAEARANGPYNNPVAPGVINPAVLNNPAGFTLPGPVPPVPLGRF